MDLWKDFSKSERIVGHEHGLEIEQERQHRKRKLRELHQGVYQPPKISQPRTNTKQATDQSEDSDSDDEGKQQKAHHAVVPSTGPQQLKKQTPGSSSRKNRRRAQRDELQEELAKDSREAGRLVGDAMRMLGMDEEDEQVEEEVIVEDSGSQDSPEPSSSMGNPAKSTHAQPTDKPAETAGPQTKIVLQDGAKHKVTISAQANQPLLTVFNAFKKHAVAKGWCRDGATEKLDFMFDGDVLVAGQTPAEIGIEDNDVVDVVGCDAG